MLEVNQVTYSSMVSTLACKSMANILCTWTVLIRKVMMLMAQVIAEAKSKQKNRLLQRSRNLEIQVQAHTFGAGVLPNRSSRSILVRDAASGIDSMEFYSFGPIK